MSATAAEKTRFRYKFDGDATTMPDAWIDDIFDEAETDYADYERRVIVAAAYLEAATQLRNRAAKQVDYQQNASSEKLGQLRAHWDAVVADYRAKLAAAIEDESGPTVRIARGKVKPTPRREYPSS